MGRHDKPIGDAHTLGAQMRRLRQLKGVSLSDMAAKLELTKGYLSMLENGMKSPTEEMQRRYNEVLGGLPLSSTPRAAIHTRYDVHQHHFAYHVSETVILKECDCGLAYLAWASDEQPVWKKIHDEEQP